MIGGEHRSRPAAVACLLSCWLGLYLIADGTAALERADQRRREQVDALVERLDRGAAMPIGVVPVFDGLYGRRIEAVERAGGVALAFAPLAAGGNP